MAAAQPRSGHHTRGAQASRAAGLWALLLAAACGTGPAGGDPDAVIGPGDATRRAPDTTRVGAADSATPPSDVAVDGPVPADGAAAAGDALGGDALAGDAVPGDADAGDGGGSDGTSGDTSGACPKGQFRASQTAPCAPATCEAMLAAVQQAIAAVTAGARACATDGDCTVVPTTTGCQGTCGEAVAKAQAAQLEAVVSWVDSHICKAQQFADQCGYATPKCMAPQPSCVQGQCAYLPP